MRMPHDFEPATFILELITVTNKLNAEHASNLLILNLHFSANGYWVHRVNTLITETPRVLFSYIHLTEFRQDFFKI